MDPETLEKTSNKISRDIELLEARPDDERKTRLQEAKETSGDRWDEFYKMHEEKFFKDRKWILKDFPEVDPQDIFWEKSRKDSRNYPNHYVLELGCGVGNTLVPILKGVGCPELQLLGCDVSPTAIENAGKRPEISGDSRVNLFVQDATRELTLPPGPTQGDISVILLIFVLSALGPEEMEATVKSAYQWLRPGGMLVVRDYAHGDLTQVRFKPEKCLAPGLYLRGDGTRACYLTRDKLRELMSHTGFEEMQNKEIKMLRTNRKTRSLMYRVMLQGKYIKR
ncbi:hypothetical protein AAMO2058_000829200 [Amorphochlora amoebiformis]|uniref:tRNA N(3)-methylcytidine methyltransferase n=1 Tax=Amorphochlora amoebiformis TaxID=1561963 RepID=A0A7S0GPY7_9EUKA